MRRTRRTPNAEPEEDWPGNPQGDRTDLRGMQVYVLRMSYVRIRANLTSTKNHRFLRSGFCTTFARSTTRYVVPLPSPWLAPRAGSILMCSCTCLVRVCLPAGGPVCQGVAMCVFAHHHCFAAHRPYLVSTQTWPALHGPWALSPRSQMSARSRRHHLGVMRYISHV